MDTDIIDDHHVSAPGQLLMTPKETAAALSVSARKLWEMTRRGEMPYVPVGRCVRYSVLDVREWIAANTRRNDSQERNVDRSESDL